MPLTIQYTPGYVWTVGEVVTEDKLNLAANPLINLFGGISSTSIADGSVTTPKFAAGALSADMAGRAVMADGYVTLVKIASGIFTADVAGRAPFVSGWLNAALMDDGTRLDVPQYAPGTQASAIYAVPLSPPIAAYVAGQQITFTADTINVGAVSVNVNSLGAVAIKKDVNVALTGGEIQANQVIHLIYTGSYFQLLNPSSAWGFTAAPASLTGANSVYTFAHGLGALPKRLRAVLVNLTADLGYSTNDEVDLNNLATSNTLAVLAGSLIGSPPFPAFTVSADATNITVTQNADSTPTLIKKSSPSGSNSITAARWKIKVYASL